MDYRLYRWVNGIDRHHTWLPHAFNVLETVGVVVIALAACSLWLLARPGGSRRWKLAAASALASAGLALLVNRLIAHFWDRARPYESHHGLYTLSHSHDPSFPSDHASAAFGTFSTCPPCRKRGEAITTRSVGRACTALHRGRG